MLNPKTNERELAYVVKINAIEPIVHSAPSAIDGEMKEGIVFRSEDGIDSFKCVDPEFLVRFHG